MIDFLDNLLEDIFIVFFNTKQQQHLFIKL